MAVYGVLGLGSIGRRHLSNLRLMHPDDDIMAVSASGTNKEPPEGVALVAVDELILLGPAYVIIASPAPFHDGAARQLLANGIPVLIEKPLAHSAEVGRSTLDYFNQIKAPRAAVGYCLRFLDSAVLVKDFIEAERIGEIYNVFSTVGQYLPQWRPEKNIAESVSANRNLGGGVLLELSHELDYLQWLLGDLTLVSSKLRNSGEFDIDVEDIADLTLSANKDVHVNVHLDFLQKSPQRECQIIGKNGRLRWIY